MAKSNVRRKERQSRLNNPAMENLKGKKKMEIEEERRSQILHHQLEEWKCLNEYINKMDMGYQQSFIIFVSIFAGVTALFTSGIVTKELMKIIFIVPLGLVAVFSYISYQFRITAILRGHLAALEEKMNEELGENVHMWNSALVETFMAHNNTINNFMMVPIMFFIFMLVIYCAYFSWQALLDVPYAKVILVGYWTLVGIGAAIVLPPFLGNGNVRRATYDEQKVMEMYRRYQSTWKEKGSSEPVKYQFPDKEENLKKKKIMHMSLTIGVLNAVLGFGVMCVFWNFADKTSGLKGLFDYYAATIGDAFFLSMLLGMGWYFNGMNAKEYPNAKRLFNLLSIAAAVVGILMQVSWILSDDTELNWTIDRIHHFNAAGWYHAAYFVTMFYLITLVVSKAVYINIKGKAEAKGCYVAMWLAGLGYWYTHVIDDYLTQNNFRSWIWGSLIAFGLAFVICEGKKLRDIRNRYGMYIGFLIGSLILAGTVCIFCLSGGLEWNVVECIQNINEMLK